MSKPLDRRAWRMASRLGLAVALFLAAAGLSPSQADDASAWQITAVSGDVTVTRQGASPIALGTTDRLGAGDVVQTGPGARLLLRRGGDTILVAPNSSVAIPAAQPGGFTSLLQGLGTLLVRVERRAAPSFEVRTPYLTAVVKGTSFAVSVDASGAGVHVLEGQVQVTDAGGSQSAMVPPGGTARVGAGPGRGLQLDGAAQRLSGSAPDTRGEGDPAGSGPRVSRPIALAAVDVERSSRGLVANDRRGDAQGGRRAAESDTADDKGGTGERRGKSIFAAMRSGGGEGGGRGIGRGIGNGNGGGNGNSDGKGNGASASAGANGNGAANSNAGGNGGGNAGGNKGGKKKK